MKKCLLFLLSGSFLLLQSCSLQNLQQNDSFTLQVNSFGEDSLLQIKSAYVEFPFEKTNNYLENREIEKYIVNALKQKGYTIKDSHTDAEVIIRADYNITKATKYFNEKIPTNYTTIPVKSTSQETDEKTVKLNKTTANNSNTETKYTYEKVATGYTVVTDSTIEYARNLNLIAYSKQLYLANSSNAALWSISVLSEGTSDDLRDVLPHMLLGSFKYIGHSSGKKIKTTVARTEQSPLYRTIKGI